MSQDKLRFKVTSSPTDLSIVNGNIELNNSTPVCQLNTDILVSSNNEILKYASPSSAPYSKEFKYYVGVRRHNSSTIHIVPSRQHWYEVGYRVKRKVESIKNEEEIDNEVKPQFNLEETFEKNKQFTPMKKQKKLQSLLNSKINILNDSIVEEMTKNNTGSYEDKMKEANYRRHEEEMVRLLPPIVTTSNGHKCFDLDEFFQRAPRFQNGLSITNSYIIESWADAGFLTRTNELKEFNTVTNGFLSLVTLQRLCASSNSLKYLSKKSGVKSDDVDESAKSFMINIIYLVGVLLSFINNRPKISKALDTVEYSKDVLGLTVNECIDIFKLIGAKIRPKKKTRYQLISKEDLYRTMCLITILIGTIVGDEEYFDYSILLEDIDKMKPVEVHRVCTFVGMSHVSSANYTLKSVLVNHERMSKFTNNK